jgi:hypothetical protein
LSVSSRPLLAERFTRTDAAFFVARAVSVYGERRGASIEALVGEWHDALRLYDPHLIEAAWKSYRNHREFFPTPAEILQRVRANLPPEGLPTYRADARVFCHDGRSEAEEIAHRTAQILRMKKDAGLSTEPIEAQRPPPKPASTAGCTPGFIALAKRQGIWRGADSNAETEQTQAQDQEP